MDIHAYRAQKEELFGSYITQVRMQADYEKNSVRTSYGFVDVFIYRPAQSSGRRLPVCFNFHGGGFVLGNAEQDNDYCRYLANHCQMMVINIDYLLAPEYPFPAAIESSAQVITSILEKASDYNIDANQVFLSGSSAGGNLIFGINEHLIENQGILSRALISNYGAMDLRGAYQTSDYEQNRHSQYVTTYLKNAAETENPLATVTLLEPHKQQKIMLNLAEKDPLLGQELVFFDNFFAKGADITKFVYPEAQHGFLHPMYQEYHALQAFKSLENISKFIENILKTL